MHFGLNKPLTVLLSLAALLLGACQQDSKEYLTFERPLQGETFTLGQEIEVGLDFPTSIKVNEVSYLVDGLPFATTKDTSKVRLSTESLGLGYRMITAVVDYDSKKDTLQTTIVLKSKVTPKALSYRVVKTYPHDTSAYTQGLSYVHGRLLESTGGKGSSVLKWVELKDGKTIRQVSLGDQFFGEGSVLVDGKIIVLTWQDQVGFVYDAQTLEKKGTFNYQRSREGWGLTYDGKHLLRSDGSNRIWRMNKDTYQEESYIEVYDHRGEVRNLNELEYIQGKIYANVYLTNKIVIIDPKTGIVEAEIDLSALVPRNYFKTDDEVQNNVLNGIAWDEAGRRLFVTGKKWPSLFEISIQ